MTLDDDYEEHRINSRNSSPTHTHTYALLLQERQLMTVDDDYEEPLLTVVEVRVVWHALQLSVFFVCVRLSGSDLLCHRLTLNEQCCALQAGCASFIFGAS